MRSLRGTGDTVDKETRDILLSLTREVVELKTLVLRNLEDDSDKEARVRKLEQWMYALPVAYLLTLGSIAASVFTTLTRSTGS